MLSFKEAANDVFNSFVKETRFKIKICDYSLQLSNSVFLIEIYFDDFFEVNTYFKIMSCENSPKINLISLVRYIKIKEEDAYILTFNQVSNQKYLKKYLECVRRIILFFDQVVKKDEFILYVNAYKRDNSIYIKEKLSNDVFNTLNDLWHSKEYKLYIKVFDENNNLIINNPKYYLFFRRRLYLKKHGNTDVGLKPS